MLNMCDCNETDISTLSKIGFKEGVLVGRKDHKFHSDYSYRRAVIIGDK